MTCVIITINMKPIEGRESDPGMQIPERASRRINILDTIQARFISPDRRKGRFSRLIFHYGGNMELERQRMNAEDEKRRKDFESVMERAASPTILEAFREELQ